MNMDNHTLQFQGLELQLQFMAYELFYTKSSFQDTNYSYFKLMKLPTICLFFEHRFFKQQNGNGKRCWELYNLPEKTSADWGQITEAVTISQQSLAREQNSSMNNSDNYQLTLPED